MKQVPLICDGVPLAQACIGALQSGGYACELVEPARAVEFALANQWPCVVIVDGPECDANQVLAQFRSHSSCSHIAVIGVAAHARLHALTAAGADAVVDAQDLLHTNQSSTAHSLPHYAHSLAAIVTGVLRRRDQWLQAHASSAATHSALQLLQSALDAGNIGALLLLRFEHFTQVAAALHSLGLSSGILRQQFHELLRARLTALLSTHTLMCFMNDETMLIALPASPSNAPAFMDDVVRAARLPLQLAEREIRLRTHAGFCTVEPAEKLDALTLIGRAEMAADDAKNTANASATHWSTQMNSRLLNDLELASAMRHAADHSEFQLLFQPQVRMDSGEVFGAEALIRWTSSSGISVAPSRFVAIAQECGVMDQITLWSLREACRHAAAWMQVGLHLRVAVNITATQLSNARFVDTVRGALAESGLAGNELALEISEAAIIANPQIFRTPLTALRNMGVSVCLDDFGVGVATLSNLKALPVNEIKLDRSFIRQLPGTIEDRMLVQTMLSLGQKLSLQTMAVGVESLTQWAWLKMQECTGAQGWLIGKATTGEELPAQVGKIRQNKIAPAPKILRAET